MKKWSELFSEPVLNKLIRDVVYAVAAVGMGNSHDEYPAQHATIAEWRMNKQT